MKPKIVIVEDEPAIADTIQYALETDGFETVHIDLGLPLLPLLDGQPADLVVLDIGLPDISGLELCRRVREKHAVPIIFLTARAEEVDRVVGLEIGGDDYVTKPFSPRELSARVRAVLRRTGRAPAAPARAPAFEVDDSRRRIRYCSVALTLSRYEYNILKTFIDRPGHVYTRERLMEMAWDEPEASMDRTVDAHIKNIRHKLRAVRGDADPIVTHRGIGYSLKEAL